MITGLNQHDTTKFFCPAGRGPRRACHGNIAGLNRLPLELISFALVRELPIQLADRPSTSERFFLVKGASVGVAH